MIYLDSSVVLARLFAEDRQPPDELWREPLFASRLLQYEVCSRVYARGFEETHGDDARVLLRKVSMVEMAPPILARALEPFPVPVRTLDAMHLATLHFLVSHGRIVSLASYDERMVAAAQALDFGIHTL